MWIAYYQNTSVTKVGFEAKYTRGKIWMWYSIYNFKCDLLLKYA
jgi:hypothetical protein